VRFKGEKRGAAIGKLSVWKWHSKGNHMAALGGDRRTGESAVDFEKKEPARSRGIGRKRLLLQRVFGDPGEANKGWARPRTQGSGE